MPPELSATLAILLNITVVFGAFVVTFLAFSLHKSKFFLLMSASWGINALYLLLEIVFFADKQSRSTQTIGYLVGLVSSVLMYLAYKSAKRGAGIRRKQAWLYLAFWAIPIIGGLVIQLIPLGLSGDKYFALMTSPGVAFSALVLLRLGWLFYRSNPTTLLNLTESPELGILSIAPAGPPIIGTLSTKYPPEVPKDAETRARDARRLLIGFSTAYGILQLAYPFRSLIGRAGYDYVPFAIGAVSKLIYLMAIGALLRASFIRMTKGIEEQSTRAVLGMIALSVEHDVRTPLSTIRSNLSLLARQDVPDSARRRYYSELRHDVERISAALQLIPEIREGQSFIDHHSEIIDLYGLTQRAIKNVRVRFSSLHLTPSIKVHGAPGVLRIKAWAPRLEQALTNIMTNCFEAFPEDSRVEIAIVLRSHEGQWAELLIRDCGCGIPRDQLNRIAQPMFSLKPLRPQSANTGMGLYIAVRLIEQHRGVIRVESDGKSFTVVTVRLPLVLRGD